MRRPLVFAAVTAGAGVFIAALRPLELWLSHTYLLVVVGFCLWFCLPSSYWKKCINPQNIRTLIFFFCTFFTGILLFQIDMSATDFMEQQIGKRVIVWGRVTEISQGDGKSLQCTVRVMGEEKTGRLKNGGKVLVRYYGTLENQSELSGKTVKLEGEPEEPQSARNPGMFNYRQYLKALGISTVMKVEDLEIVDPHRPWVIKWIWTIKSRFKQALENNLNGEISGLIYAMMFGEKAGLDEDLYRLFQKKGTAHILAVSGLHIGILYGFIQAVWPGKKGAAFYWFVLLFLLFYMALASFSPSVVRAGSMIILHIIAGLLHRRYDLLSAAAGVFLLMLFIRPMQLFFAGFQLSFLAIASLGVLLPAFAGKIKGVFLPATAIQLGMTPYTIYLFHSFSLAAFFINIPVIFLAGLLIPLGLLLIFLSFGSPCLFHLAAAVMEIGCRGMILGNRIACMGGKTVFDVAGPSVFLLVFYYANLFFFLSEKGRILLHRKQWKQLMATVGIAAFLAGAASVGADQGWSGQDLLFLDVGQGDCLMIQSAEGKHYLIDGGGSAFRQSFDVGRDTLKPFLLRHGIRKIDAAFVSHLHEDHYGGIRSLAQEGMIGQLGLYGGNQVQEDVLCRETGLSANAFLYLHQGQSVTLGKDLSIEILSPERKSRQEYEEMIALQEDENASSLIMKVHCKGISVLMTGDIDQEGEALLVEQYGTRLQSDILKVAHHGSKYSSSDAFLNAVHPRFAVFQVGKNNFGHPSESVIEKCRQKGIIVYRNDQDGAVGITVDRKGIVKVRTMLKQENDGRIQ